MNRTTHTALASCAATICLVSLIGCTSSEDAKPAADLSKYNLDVDVTTYELSAPDPRTEVTIELSKLPKTSGQISVAAPGGDVELEIALLLAPMEPNYFGKVPVLTIPKDANFASGSTELPPTAAPVLDNVVRLIGLIKEQEIWLDGHTDSKDEDDINKAISLARAEAVKSYLVSKGVPEHLLKTEGKGETFPRKANTYIDGTDRPEFRALNRRVTMRVADLSPREQNG